MSKCTKVKRPCKICLETVTLKNGLQCQGACQSWVHYACLSYTPGKIRDIKNGIIKVTCPCPDCKTVLPKEYRTDQPFSCSNQKCPANRPPKCQNQMCPINNSEIRATTPDPCPLNTCGTSCKQHSDALLPYGIPPPKLPTQSCVPLPPEPRVAPSLSDGCFDPNRCASGCSSTSAPPRRDVPGDYGNTAVGPVSSKRAMENMCNTISILTNQLNELMSKMQKFSSDNHVGGTGYQKARDCKPAMAHKTLPVPKAEPDDKCNCRTRDKKV